MTHSEGFKKQLVEKTLGPPRRNISSVAREAGIAKSTLFKWIRLSKGNSAKNHILERGNAKQSLSPTEKVEILLKAASLPQDELGGFLRGRGLYETHLEAFRAEAVLGLSGSLSDGTLKAELHRERQKNRELERELRRKDKALAETAALLVLQKKSQLLWGDEENTIVRRNG